MIRRPSVLVHVTALSVFFISSVRAQTMDPAYAGAYVITNLGSVPSVPTRYGGLTLKYNDPNLLLIGGEANTATGAIYAIAVTRAGGHINGFAGTASLFAAAPYNDGGVVYGPGNVLFLARWPVDELGQSLPGSSMTDKVIDVAPFGVEGSLSALNFVPTGFPGAGRMKLCTWQGGQWLDASLAPDGMGTYNLVNVTEVPASRLGCGPEGFVYIPAGLPLFPNPTMLVSEYSCNSVAAYDIDVNGDPILATRRVFASGLFGAEGACLDPLTGDFLFSTFGGSNQVIVVRGFSSVCTTCRGDLDANNRVDGADIAQFVTCFLHVGPPAGLCLCADMDIDGDLDLNDLALFITKVLGTNDPDPQCP